MVLRSQFIFYFFIFWHFSVCALHMPMLKNANNKRKILLTSKVCGLKIDCFCKENVVWSGRAVLTSYFISYRYIKNENIQNSFCYFIWKSFTNELEVTMCKLSKKHSMFFLFIHSTCQFNIHSKKRASEKEKKRKTRKVRFNQARTYLNRHRRLRTLSS